MLNNNKEPNDGFVGIPKNITLKKETKIDKSGDHDGRFTSPAGTPRGQRTLAPGSSQDLHTKPLPAKSGEAKAWFDEVGEGIQHKFEKSIQELIDEGFLKEIF